MEFTTQQRLLLERKRRRRASIDNDECGDNMPFYQSNEHHSREAHVATKETLVQAAVAYGAGVKEPHELALLDLGLTLTPTPTLILTLTLTPTPTLTLTRRGGRREGE